jgi:RNA polymerase sigma-70 factor (ECF subfamily)
MQPFLNDDVLRALVESLEAPPSEEPEASARRGELIDLVQSALDQLPTRYADVLELRYVLGLSSKEIAQRLQVGDEAAQSLLGRARRAFRDVCSEAAFASLRADGSP